VFLPDPGLGQCRHPARWFSDLSHGWPLSASHCGLRSFVLCSLWSAPEVVYFRPDSLKSLLAALRHRYINRDSVKSCFGSSVECQFAQFLNLIGELIERQNPCSSKSVFVPSFLKAHGFPLYGQRFRFGFILHWRSCADNEVPAFLADTLSNGLPQYLHGLLVSRWVTVSPLKTSEASCLPAGLP
jgi:hypothetical protein